MDFLGATIFRMVEAIWMNSFLYFLCTCDLCTISRNNLWFLFCLPTLDYDLHHCEHFILVIIKYILESFCFLLEKREHFNSASIFYNSFVC